MATRNVKTQQAARAVSGSDIRPATIVELGESSDRARVRVTRGRGGTEPSPARIAQIPGYRASVGDRVLVAGDGADLYILAILRSARAPALTLPDGATAEVKDGAIELRDPEGRLLIRYSSGQAEIAAPAGDLTLAAPHGRVVLKSGVDVSIDAARDVVHRAARRIEFAVGEPGGPPQIRVESVSTEVKVDRFSLQSKTSRIASGQIAVFARSIATTAERVATHADRIEAHANRLIEKTRDALREVSDLAETRIGRARTRVMDIYSLRSGRTIIASEEETTIDGKKILLG